MTTTADAIKTALDDNWTGAGGTKPALYNSEDFNEDAVPIDDDWIMIMNRTYTRRRKRRNDDYVGEKYTIQLIVSTKNDANKEERLDTLVNEVDRIMTTSGVTGFNLVDTIFEERRISPGTVQMYQALLTVELTIYSTSSAVTAGSTGSLDLTVGGDLTVQGNDIKDSTNTICITMSGDSTGDVKVHGDVTLGQYIKDPAGNTNIEFASNGQVRNPIDNKGFVTGAGNDARMYHDGSDSVLVTLVGMWKFESATGHEWDVTGTNYADLTDAGLRLGEANARCTTILDEDAMGSDSATSLCTQQSIKAYVDAQVAAENELSEMNDVTISAPADNEFLAYNNATSKWINQTRAEAGIADGDIDHDNLNNFVGNKHIDHTAVTLTAGAGMTGGGTIAASRTFNVIGGTGITVNANDIDCDITQYTDGLARTACLEDAAYAAGWDGDTTHAPTQNAVYDKINAMDTLIAANTTVAEVEAIIDAEIVNGQSIDVAIDTLIATHAAIEAAHGMEHDDLTDTTMTGSEVQDMLGFSSGNKFYMPFMPVPVFDAQIKVDGGGRVFSLNSVGDFIFFLPLPLLLGSLTLHIDQFIVGVQDADAGDFVDRVLLRYTDQDGDITTVLDDGTNRTAKGNYTYGDGGAGVVNPEDTAGVSLVMLYVIGSITTPADLDIAVCTARCWYA